MEFDPDAQVVTIAESEVVVATTCVDLIPSATRRTDGSKGCEAAGTVPIQRFTPLDKVTRQVTSIHVCRH